MSRITRREMKRDDLVATIATVSTVLERHTRSIVIATVAVAVLAVAVTGGIFWSRSRARSANEALTRVNEAAVAAAFADDDAGYLDVIARADEVIESYPSSGAASWARHWKAHSQAQRKEYDAALTTLEPLLAPGASPETAALHQGARMLKARILEAQGNLQGAADELGGLVAEAPQDFPLEVPLMERARLLERIGKADEAREIYTRIGREFAQSPFASEALRKLGTGSRSAS